MPAVGGRVQRSPRALAMTPDRRDMVRFTLLVFVVAFFAVPLIATHVPVAILACVTVAGALAAGVVLYLTRRSR